MRTEEQGGLPQGESEAGRKLGGSNSSRGAPNMRGSEYNSEHHSGHSDGCGVGRNSGGSTHIQRSQCGQADVGVPSGVVERAKVEVITEMGLDTEPSQGEIRTQYVLKLSKTVNKIMRIRRRREYRRNKRSQNQQLRAIARKGEDADLNMYNHRKGHYTTLPSHEVAAYSVTMHLQNKTAKIDSAIEKRAKERSENK